jgi:hypothetical protein
MSRKIDRALHGPSWGEVILGAALSLLLGVVLGATLLMFRPVVVVRQMPAEEAIDPKAVYFVEGSRETSRARDAAAKRKAFLDGQSVTVIEDELNALAGSAMSSAAPKSGASPTAEGDGGDGMLATGTPNFRIRDGAMQVGVPVTLSLLGLSRKLTVQTRGGFVKQGGQFQYAPDTVYVGSLPLQRVPMLANFARNQFLDSQSLPEDIKAAWASLADVSIEGNVLNLTMP